MDKQKELLQILGQKVLEARKKKGYTQTDLALLLGIKKARVSKIEKGLSNFTIGTLLRMAEALDLELNVELKERVETTKGNI